MPIHEYQCSRCKNIFELLHKMDEDCEAVCPKCMAPARKMISATSFVLKGSGFYVNDYPSKSRKDARRAEKEGPDKVSPGEKRGKEGRKDAGKDQLKGSSHCSLSLTS